MKQFNVTGMSCAACSARVEKAVSKLNGVESCSVSLLTNSMGVEGSVSPDEVIKAVAAAGYGASLKGAENEAAASPDEDSLKDRETPVLKKRLLASLGFLIVLMYFSMGHMMLNFPLPGWVDGNHVAMGLVQLILAAIVMVINQKFFINGTKGLLHRAANMDTLVAMGSFASFAWSVFVLFLMTDAVVKSDEARVLAYMDEFYFESAAMIVTLITIGKMLEARSKGKTTDALKSLMRLSPKHAVVVRGGKEVTIPIEQLRKDEIFIVRPGENIPADGIIVEGSCAVNEAALTGESIPVDKAEGDSVSAATANLSGFIKCSAERVGQDTTLSQIIKMVSDAAATKAPIAKIADTVSGIFVPAVIAIAAVTTVIWLVCGQTLGFALARGISVLVISCPCALGLATPVAIMVSNGMGAKHGILFKTAVSLEETGRTQIAVLDKTGTITNGEPKVTDLTAANGFSEKELLSLALSLEAKSEHPLAKAVLKKAEEENIAAEEVTDFRALPGNGLSARLNGEILIGGSMKYISENAEIAPELMKKAEELAENGKTPLLFVKGNSFIGIIAVADTIKGESPAAIRRLRNMGIKVVMLTGDNKKTAAAIGEQAGVDKIVAGVLPDGKEAVVKKLMEYGKVAMVGDGINDAPALTRANIGIAIGAGADVAIDAADVVLMKSSLADVPAAIALSRATLKNIRENLFWAFFYNSIGIPLAAGAFISLLGWKMNPMFGAAAMSLSSFCVVSNALRLNLFDLGNEKHDKKIAPVELPNLESEEVKEAEDKDAKWTNENSAAAKTATIQIEGMMCEHCEAAVKKALEAIDGIETAQASHEQGTAIITMTKDVDDETIIEAITKEDYEVKGIERHKNG